MSDLSDNELLALFRKEDTRHYAFNLLVRQHQRLLYGFIRRMTCSRTPSSRLGTDWMVSGPMPNCPVGFTV
jgi:hypothetical protein